MDERPAGERERKPSTDDDDLAPGTLLLGKYSVQSVLGRGSACTVYTATHVPLQRRVALKVLRRGPDRERRRARLLREARLLAEIEHPSIVKVFEHGAIDDETAFLALELLEGETLAQRVGRGVLPARDALLIAEPVLGALEEVHAHGVVHRDVTLENIFLEGDRVVLLDFGSGRPDAAVRLTGSAGPVGTPGHLAPEQLHPDIPVDARTDVYQLGVSIYRALTGAFPFAGSGGELFARILFEPALAPSKLRPDVPAAVDALVDKALAKAPTARFQSAAEMRGAVLRCLASRELPPTTRPRQG